MSSSFSPEPPFAPPPYSQAQFANPPRSKGGSWMLGLVLALLGILTLGGVVCVAGIWYVASNLDRWLVGLGREAIVAMIEDSEIPDGEKKEVVTQVDRVVNAYKERKINQADLEKALNELGEAPALRVLSLYGLDEAYLEGTGLSEAEVKAGRRTFERALRGVYEGKLTEDDLYASLPAEAAFNQNAGNNADSDDLRDQITLVNGNAQQSVSDDDLREWLLKLKVMVDNARIPDEAFQLDIGDEVTKVVDKLLAGK